MVATRDDFEVWYRRSFRRLAASLAIVAGDLDGGREAAAEACCRALERWDRIGLMESPEAWAYRVGVNVLRRRQRRAALELRLLRRGLSQTSQRPAMDPEVWDAVRALPPRQRQAIALRYLLDLTQAEVAESMGVAPGTAAATLVSARRRLAERLDPGRRTTEVEHG